MTTTLTTNSSLNRIAPGARTRNFAETFTLPHRIDVHRLDELQHLCLRNTAKNLLLDAREVRFIDTAGLKFLENLDTVRRTAGATVGYLRPSPALVATFDLHGSKLAQAEMIRR